MKVIVRLYGAPRVALGWREGELDLPEGATVAELIQKLILQSGAIAEEYLKGPRGLGYGVVFLVNGVSTGSETILAEGDCVTLMPAVGGG